MNGDSLYDPSPGVVLNLSSDELDLLSNCLNEVLNGMSIQGLEDRLGISRSCAAAMLRNLSDARRPDKGGTVRVECLYPRPLAKAVEVAIAELGVEFSIRTGFTAEEATAMTAVIESRVFSCPSPSDPSNKN